MKVDLSSQVEGDVLEGCWYCFRRILVPFRLCELFSAVSRTIPMHVEDDEADDDELINKIAQDPLKR